jgi:beta-galactosidase
VGADGTPVPLYEEVAQLGAEFAKAGAALAGTTVQSDVAILQSYDSRWAVNFQRHNRNFDPVDEMQAYYGALRAQVHSVDVVSPTVVLSGYKLVVAPGLNVMGPEVARNLIAYVRGGGHLVLGQRSGMKDDDNGLQPERQPGPLETLLGGRVEQFYALDMPVPVEGNWGAEETKIWAEQLAAKDSATQVLMRYGKSNGWLDGQPAALTRKVGNGSITYIGAALDGETMKAAAGWMLEQSGIRPAILAMPEGVDLYVRGNAEKEVWILINFGDQTQQVKVPAGFTDVLQGGSAGRAVSLKRFDVAVLERRR